MTSSTPSDQSSQRSDEARLLVGVEELEITEAVKARYLKLSIETTIEIDVYESALFLDLICLYSKTRRVNYKINKISGSEVSETIHITHQDDSGNCREDQGDKPWAAYRCNKVLDQGRRQLNQDLIFLLPNELLVDTLIAAKQLAGITFAGHWRSRDIRETARLIHAHLPGRSIVVDPNLFSDDIDLQRVIDIFQSVGVQCFVVQLTGSSSPEPSQLESQLEDRAENITKSTTKWSQTIEKNINQRVLDNLYEGQAIICVDNVLYVWRGTYYQQRSDSDELRNITEFLNTVTEEKWTGNDTFVLTHPYAKPSVAKEALDWIKFRHIVGSEQVNPPGLNCTNGVLKLIWNDFYPNWALLPHSPRFYYTYEPQFAFDPNANPEQCDNLLQVLDESEREVFLRVIAASLDLETVRRRKGRTVRALLLKGLGNNGKDALREVVSLMYGHQGMTSVTIADFQIYDSGRKFNLAPLVRSRINWASENANVSNIDKIQSLKAFITGDPLEHERKNKDPYEFKPKGICIFNCNDTPNILASIEAIKSRFAIIRFNKTFKENADPDKGEIEADPKFRYDQKFLRDEVLPSFLNYALYALRDLIDNGIDYACSDEALREIRLENSHLLQFCEDEGLDYQKNGFVRAKEIWARLEAWYQANGTLQIEGRKRLWADQVNPRDKTVKASNQVIDRLRELFPGTKRYSPGKNVHGILGLGFRDQGCSEQPGDQVIDV